jgi:hypothetical protein
MAMRIKITTANGMLDTLATLFPAGSILEVYKNTIPTDADTATSGQTLLASITLPATPWAAASARSKSKNNTWSDSSADAGSADTPTWCRLKNAADTERLDFTAGIGSGDISFDGTITAGQVVTISTLAITG